MKQPFKRILASITMTALTAYLLGVMPKSFMPAVDVGNLSGSLEASQDNSFDRMIVYGTEVNKILATIPWMETIYPTSNLETQAGSG